MCSEGWTVMKMAGLVLLFLPCVITDIKKREIPVGYTLGLGLIWILYRIYRGADGKNTLMAAVFLLALLLLLSFTSRGIGPGDAFLCSACVCIAGFPAAFLGLFHGVMLAGLTGGVLYLIKRKKHQKLPFAPFYFAGMILKMVPELLKMVR